MLSRFAPAASLQAKPVRYAERVGKQGNPRSRGGSDEFDAELKDDLPSASRLLRLIRLGQPLCSIIKADSCNSE